MTSETLAKSLESGRRSGLRLGLYFLLGLVLVGLGMYWVRHLVTQPVEEGLEDKAEDYDAGHEPTEEDYDYMDDDDFVDPEDEDLLEEDYDDEMGNDDED